MITEKHIHVLRHALGADSREPGYRNYFDPGGDDVQLCRELAGAGLMEPYMARSGDELYRATKAGIAAVLRPKDIKRMERER